MKNSLFFAFLAFLPFISCSKENPVVSNYKEIVKAVDLKNMSDTEILEYFSSIENKSSDLHDFSLKKINDKDISQGQRADFSKDKIDFNARIRFADKSKFFGISNSKIDVSDDKKNGYFSSNDSRLFITGYFKDGKFYFSRVNKLGF